MICTFYVGLVNLDSPCHVKTLTPAPLPQAGEGRNIDFDLFKAAPPVYQKKTRDSPGFLSAKTKTYARSGT